MSYKKPNLSTTFLIFPRNQATAQEVVAGDYIIEACGALTLVNYDVNAEVLRLRSYAPGQWLEVQKIDQA